ncbi:hypothetical protein D3C78_580540 [compost metagenome]
MRTRATDRGCWQQAQGDDLHRYGPGSPRVGELWQQGQKQQKDLRVQAADAGALQGPVRPGAFLLNVACQWSGRVAQHADPKPQQVAGAGQRERRHRQGSAGDYPAHTGGHDQGGRQMAGQQSSSRWNHASAAHAGGNHVGPIGTGRNDEQ